MSRLYLKIFLGFWLVTIVMVVVTSWSVSLLVEDSSPGRPKFGAARDAVAMLDHVEEILDRHGAEGLRRWLRGRPESRFVFVLDNHGDDLLGRFVPPGVRGEGRRRFELREIDTGQGRFTIGVAKPRKHGFQPHPEIFGLRMGIAIAVSGIFCWLLARYLTQPIVNLHGAVRRLMCGDLNARSGAANQRRRDELVSLGVDFDTMADRLQHSIESRQQFLRDVSHEMRSPLARISVALELARKRAGGADRELDRIGMEVERMDAMISQLMSIIRLESDLGKAERQSVSLSETLANVADDAEFEAAEKGVSVETRIAEPVTVNGYHDSLRSMIENVLRNAIRYAPPDSSVQVALDRSGDKTCRIVIADAGPGVSADKIARLFEPFYRADHSRSRESGGHGLGLAIAYRVAKLHGGEIAAKNRSGGGLEVTITLPAD